MLLANPVCVLAYAAATWYFFYDRIPHEEELLVEFFGDAYRQYRKRSAIGVPPLLPCHPLPCAQRVSGARHPNYILMSCTTVAGIPFLDFAIRGVGA